MLLASILTAQADETKMVPLVGNVLTVRRLHSTVNGDTSSMCRSRATMICTSVGQEHVLDHPSFLISVVIWSLVIKVIKDFQFSLGGGKYFI
jgi:hypothetical protein